MFLANDRPDRPTKKEAELPNRLNCAVDASIARVHWLDVEFWHDSLR